MQLKTSCDFSVSHRHYIKNDFTLTKWTGPHWEKPLFKKYILSEKDSIISTNIKILDIFCIVFSVLYLVHLCRKFLWTRRMVQWNPEMCKLCPLESQIVSKIKTLKSKLIINNENIYICITELLCCAANINIML